jgi:hypothetical protein
VAASAAILPAVAAPDPAASLQTSSLAVVAISGIGPGVATTVATATTSLLLCSAFPSLCIICFCYCRTVVKNYFDNVF